MRDRRFVLVWVGIALLLVVLIGASVQSAPERPIKIGAIFDLTGTLAPLGEDSKRGALLALEQAGYRVAGKPVEFVFEDGASDPTTSLDKARKLVDTDKVVATFGPVHSGCGEAIAGYLDRVKVPNLSISHHSDNMPLKRQWMWLSCGILRQGAYAGGMYAFEGAGFKTVTTIASDYVAGRDFVAGFVQGFQEKGGKVIQQQWFPQGTKDYTPFIVGLQPADFVAVFTTGAECLGFFRQYGELGGKMPLFSITADPLSPSIAKQLGNLTKGMIARGNWYPTDETPGNKEFVQSYQKKYGDIPGEKSAGAFVATQIILKALADTRGETSSDLLHKALVNVSFDTIHGRIAFTQDRVAIFTYPIAKVDTNLVPKVVARYTVRADKAGDKMAVKLVNRVF
jgi:branched-chain amino acid transport system substrate-binding protein